jgi:Tol biopolymer transport system component
VAVGKKTSIERFDSLALLTIVFSILLIILAVWTSASLSLSVSNFSWQNRQIGSLDRHFILDFNRPADRSEIEKNLQIQPPLKGNTSWSGNRLFYTLTEIPLAETQYRLKILGSKTIAPFNGSFQTRDRIFAYLGISPEEEGRIVLYNYTKKQGKILTPKDLVVTEFRVVADGKKIVFFAYDRNNPNEGLDRLQLYTVATGLDSVRFGSLKKIIDADRDRNIDFDVSEDGKTIVLARVDRQKNDKTSLWSIVEGEKPVFLGIIGENFNLSPDGKILAVIQNSGVNLIDLKSSAKQSQFLENYAEIVDFSAESDRLILAKYNADYSRSYFLLDLLNKERSTEIFKSFSSISNCQFEPRQKKTIYCIKNDLTVEGGQYRQTPFLIAIDPQTRQSLPLLSLPNAQDVRLSISSDGALLLFDQTNASSLGQTQSVTNGSIWRLPLLDIEATGKTAPPQQLNLGFYPQWLP